MELHELLKQRRLDLRLDTSQMARRIGYSRSWISRLEGNTKKHHPSSSGVKRLSIGYELPEERLIKALGFRPPEHKGGKALEEVKQASLFRDIEPNINGSLSKTISTCRNQLKKADCELQALEEMLV